MLNIVLVEPEIPGNTGNVSRTCAVIGAALHLVGPLGFSVDEKHLRRAGLDYWDKLQLFQYGSLAEFFQKNQGGTFYYFSTKAKKNFYEVSYREGDFLVFGKETAGLPEWLVFSHADTSLRIPMQGELRCLNLANSVAVAAYEVMRQWNYRGLE